MSINITVHGNKLEKTTRKSIFADPEHVKKERLAERRKQRLEQVRQQSKEVAQQVRQNVNEEIKKQERQIEEQKHKELLEWREKAIAEARAQRNASLNAVGNAHRAALNEREAEALFVTTKRRRSNIAQERGRSALQKEREKSLISKPGCHTLSQSAKKPKHKMNVNSTKRQAESATRRCINAIDEESSGFSTEEEYDVSKTSTSIKQNKPVIMEINTDSDDSSSISVMDSHEASNRHFYRTKENPPNAEFSKTSYNALDYRQNETSSSDKSNPVEQTRPRQFTKISEFIQRRQPKLAVSKSTLEISAPETDISSLPAKSCLKTKPQQESASTSKLVSQTIKNLSNFPKPRSEISNSVQFYDYDSKYSKQYQPGQCVVKSLKKNQDQINAMESARLEQQLQRQQREKPEQAQTVFGQRKKAEERFKQTMETEKVRRDCQLLKQQLEVLNQEQNNIRGFGEREHAAIFPMKFTFEKAAETKKKTLEPAFIDRSSKPAVNTYRKFEEKVPTTSAKGKHERIANSVDNPDKMNDYQLNCDEVSSSESCATTLLDYVNKQSDQISRDIKRCGNSNTLKELKCLLDKINQLRDRILDEINKCKIRDEKNTAVLDNIARHIEELCNEREKILSEEKENIESMKKNLDKREKRLKEKEEFLRRKLENIAANKKISEKSPAMETKEETTTKNLDKVPSTVPIEIIIKLRNETTTGKSPSKSPRKVSSLIQDFKHAKRKKISLVKQRPSKPSEQSLPRLEKPIEVSPARSKSSTSYLSLPEVMHTKLGEMLSIPVVKNDSDSRKEKKITVNSQHDDKALNPTLLHYIQRLLGMSRSSIDMLGVSSSEIETPSSSLVANPTNISTESLDIQTERLQRLKEFINDNYSLISELEESFKSSKSSSSLSSSSNRLAERVWQAALQKSENEMVVSNLEKQIKSILKRKTANQESKQMIARTQAAAKKSVQTQVSDISKSDKSLEVQLPLEKNEPATHKLIRGGQPATENANQLVDKYAELTTNCTKRITELTNMINKVRQEKQKILETTLTSGSETGRLSTEYCDLPEVLAAKSDDDSSKVIELKSAIDIQLESDRVLLEKNKLTGVSRDSGISLSRPVTALDAFDANVCVPEKFNLDQRYDSISKDTPKISPQRPQDTSATMRKQLRPPATIARYSPQLIEDRAHELSTILEVETPATSRLHVPMADKNISVLEVNISGSLKKVHEFPTYEEYVAKHNLDVSQFISIDVSSKLPIGLDKLQEASGKGNLQYQEFPSLNTYLRHQDQVSDIQHENATSNSNYQHFPSHKSYVERFGVSGLLDSQSIAAVSISDATNKPDDSESTESLPDVVAELKKRNVLTRSFRNEEVANTLKLSSDESSPTPSVTDSEIKNVPTSKRTPTDAQAVWNTSEAKSPVKQKVKIVSHSKPDRASKDREGKSTDLTGIELLPSTTTSTSKDTSESLGRELNDMGLKWASLMLKKSQQSMELGSTSSSFTYEHRKSPKKSPGKKKAPTAMFPDPLVSSNIENSSQHSKHANDRSSPDSGGKAFNLKDFFTKELLKRATTSASVSSTDDSVASQFIRSLLGSANSTQTATPEGRTAPDRQRHHTSTPVQQTKSSSSSKSSEDASKLFSAESCISSVRMSSGTQTAHVQLQDRDALSASHLRLNIEKRSSSIEYGSNEKSS